MTTSVAPAEQIASPAQVWRTGLLAAVIASVANVIVYFAASALGVSFNITPPDMPAPPFAAVVAFVTTFGVLLGTLVLTLMPRFSRRPISTFRVIAIGALLLSFLQPLLLTTGVMPLTEPVSTATILVLELMHVIAGVVAIWLLTTQTRA